MYSVGKTKTIYKTDKKYNVYRSSGRELITKPPPPPSGAAIFAHSIFSHVFDDPHLSSNVQLWIYVPKDQVGAGEWKPTAPGATSTQTFDGVSYQIRWKEGKGASWVKAH